MLPFLRLLTWADGCTAADDVGQNLHPGHLLSSPAMFKWVWYLKLTKMMGKPPLPDEDQYLTKLKGSEKSYFDILPPRFRRTQMLFLDASCLSIAQTGLQQTQGMLPLVPLLTWADGCAKTDDAAGYLTLLHGSQEPACSLPRFGLRNRSLMGTNNWPNLGRRLQIHRTKKEQGTLDRTNICGMPSAPESRISDGHDMMIRVFDGIGWGPKHVSTSRPALLQADIPMV